MTLRVLERLRGYPLRVHRSPLTGLDFWDTCSLYEALKFTGNEVLLVVACTEEMSGQNEEWSPTAVGGGLILWYCRRERAKQTVTFIWTSSGKAGLELPEILNKKWEHKGPQNGMGECQE